MLTKLMMGRLGNQMFQYAAMRAIQEKYYSGELINLDFSQIERNGKKEDGFRNQLTGFKLNREEVDFNKKTRLGICQWAQLAGYFVRRKILKMMKSKEKYEDEKRELEKRMQKRLNRNGLFLYSYGYYSFEKSKKKNKFFLGFFESPQYFDEIKTELMREFTPIEAPLEKNGDLYRVINESASVCVSIRRGDFVSDRFRKEAFVCTPDYFKRAIDMMKELVPRARFIVFSDDVEWVKKHMDLPEDTVFEDGDDPIWEKMRLMYSCKHFIISNSTFSWWAQYLSRNKNKVVIAPDRWRNVGYDGRDLYMKEWKLVKA